MDAGPRALGRPMLRTAPRPTSEPLVLRHLWHQEQHRGPGRDRTNGLRSLGSGLALFVAFGLFFEGVIGLSGPPFLSTELGPVVLIGAGIAVLLLGLVRGRRLAA